MPVKTSTLDRLDFDAADMGDIGVRIRKLTKFDDGLMKEEYHRAFFHAGDDLEGTLVAINADLRRQGFPDIEAEGLATLRAEAARRWTRARIDKRAEQARTLARAGVGQSG